MFENILVRVRPVVWAVFILSLATTNVPPRACTCLAMASICAVACAPCAFMSTVIWATSMGYHPRREPDNPGSGGGVRTPGSLQLELGGRMPFQVLQHIAELWDGERPQLRGAEAIFLPQQGNNVLPRNPIIYDTSSGS